jgi:hypothetical protein
VLRIAKPLRPALETRLRAYFAAAEYNVADMSSPAQDVRAGVARAERLRRARATGAGLWRAAPMGAAVCAGLAAGVRWAGWPPLVLWGAGGAGLVALGAYLYNARRDRAVSDAAAADIDGRAGLGGELRSASWFAAGDGTNEWIDFHVARAAKRLEAVDWPGLYPPVRALRAKAATALLAVATIVLVVPAVGRDPLHAIGSRVPGAAVDRVLAGINLPPDLRKKLEEILKAAEEGSMASTGRPLTEAEVRDLLARLTGSPELKNAKEANRIGDPSAKQMEQSSKEMQALAERARRASEMASLSPEVKDALSDVAEKLAEMSEASAGPKDPNDAMGSVDAPKGDAAQAKKGGGNEEASIQAVKDTSAGGGIGVVMMSSDDPKGAQEAGLGLGGGSSERKNGGQMALLDAALRKETIEAYKDDTGDKTTQDLRRKTEKATATVGYAGIQPAAFDKGRAAAPPAVPESRRAALQTYFIRKQ